MNKPLLLKLWLLLALGTVALFWAIALLLDNTERELSMLSEKSRQQLLDWRDQAELLYLRDPSQLALWLQQLRQQEKVWVTVANVQVDSVDQTDLQARFTDGFILGRSIDWPIHLYLDYNPVMDLPFVSGDGHLMIELPSRLRPGDAWRPLKWLLQLLLPLCLLLALCYLIYQHLMRPIRQLQQAALNMEQGLPHQPLRPALGQRQDELSQLADSFDQMAQQVQQQLQRQRQFVADLSHELRTPLTRFSLALDCLEQGINIQGMPQRLRQETDAMQQLVANALTLAWLDSETESQNSEQTDLPALLDTLCDNARFEYPDRQLETHYPEELQLNCGRTLWLSQALENVLRNALRFTPVGGIVRLQVQAADYGWLIRVSDQGPGVPEAELQRLFDAFFRLPGAEHYGKGYGLGLALTRRLINACGGRIRALNLPGSGLVMEIELPQM